MGRRDRLGRVETGAHGHKTVRGGGGVVQRGGAHPATPLYPEMGIEQTYAQEIADYKRDILGHKWPILVNNFTNIKESTQVRPRMNTAGSPLPRTIEHAQPASPYTV